MDILCKHLQYVITLMPSVTSYEHGREVKQLPPSSQYLSAMLLPCHKARTRQSTYGGLKPQGKRSIPFF